MNYYIGDTMFLKIILIIFVFLFQSDVCYLNKNKKEISKNQIFTMKSERYLVVFVNSTCPSCITLVEYIAKNKFNIDLFYYTVDFDEKLTSSNQNNIGINTSDLLKINVTPTILEIKNWIVTFQCIGLNNTHQYLENFVIK